MMWAELEQLTDQVQQLPVERQQTSQRFGRVLLAAHSTLIKGSRVTVEEAIGFLLGTLPVRTAEKLSTDYGMLRDLARAHDLA